MKPQHLLLPSAALFGLVACHPEEPAAPNHLVLHYSQPASFFEETLPVGNGQLGALIYGGVADEHISLNDIALWTGGPDLDPWTPDAYKYLPQVRALLDKEDYRAADLANMQIEGHNSELYQPLGSLLLTDLKATDKEVLSYERKLDISRALATVSYSVAEGQSVERECFVSGADSVIVLRLKSYGTSLSQRIGLTSKIESAKVSANDNTLVTEGYTAYNTKLDRKDGSQGFRYDPDRGIHFRTELRVLAPNGCVKADSDTTLLIEGCDEAVIILTDVTSYNGPYNDPATAGRDYRGAVAQRMDAACQKSYVQLQSRHEEDYQRLFNRVQLDLGQTPDSIFALDTDKQLLLGDDIDHFNPDLEELYFQFGRYLLISSSRTEGIPANLQGLWNESMTPPWSCNYTCNINVEENYWPSEVGGMPEMHQSFLQWIERLPKSGAISAANYYGIAQQENSVTPWCLCHNSDVWCMTNPVGYQREDTEWCCWPIGGAWVSSHLWEHYMFTQDRQFLSRVYPVMAGAAQFCMDWLVEKDGYLMTSPSTSPENDYRTPDGFEGSTLYGGSADVGMIRELLLDLRNAASVLSAQGEQLVTDNAFLARVDTTLAHLLPYRIGKKGNLQEWYYDWEDEEPTHRHQSHLYGLYPGHHITVAETPELAAACAKTLEIKGEKTTGWSAGWRVNLLARLKNGDGAYHMLRTLMHFVHPRGYQGEDIRKGGGTYANLFDAHPPFQIDGNFGGASGVMEMLVQSRWISDTEAEAEVLPALPKQWSKEGTVKGLRLRGGWELSMSWKDGKVTKLDVKSLRQTPGKLTVKQADGQTWEF